MEKYLKNLNLSIEKQKQITKKNLLKVVNELPELAKKFPDIINDFDMSVLGIYDCSIFYNIKEIKCDTIGCLLGNSARIFIKDIIKKNIMENYYFNYYKFGYYYFPYLYNNNNILLKKQSFNYLYSAHWAFTKFYDFNSAINRIKNLINNDLECLKFSYKTNKIIR